MQFDETLHFLRESFRSLKPGASLLFTAFLWDDDSSDSVLRNSTAFTFVHKTQNGRIENVEEPDLAVAHDRRKLLEALSSIGFEKVNIVEGSWRGTPSISAQDIVTAAKPK